MGQVSCALPSAPRDFDSRPVYSNGWNAMLAKPDAECPSRCVSDPFQEPGIVHVPKGSGVAGTRWLAALLSANLRAEDEDSWNWVRNRTVLFIGKAVFDQPLVRSKWHTVRLAVLPSFPPQGSRLRRSATFPGIRQIN